MNVIPIKNPHAAGLNHDKEGHGNFANFGTGDTSGEN